MTTTPATPTPDAAKLEEIRLEREIRNAAREGHDLRPGKRVSLRVVSKTHNQVVAGHLVTLGESIVRNVHVDDVPEFMHWVEDATPEELALVDRELKHRVKQIDDARRRGERLPISPLVATHEAAFCAALGRASKPFSLVEVLDDEPAADAAPAPAAPAARKRA
jgi:hypothetical protein